MTKIMLKAMYEYSLINIGVTVICTAAICLSVALDVSGQTDRIEAAIKDSGCGYQLKKVEGK